MLLLGRRGLGLQLRRTRGLALKNSRAIIGVVLSEGGGCSWTRREEGVAGVELRPGVGWDASSVAWASLSQERGKIMRRGRNIHAFRGKERCSEQNAEASEMRGASEKNSGESRVRKRRPRAGRGARRRKGDELGRQARRRRKLKRLRADADAATDARRRN